MDGEELVGQLASEGWRGIKDRTGVFSFPARNGQIYVTANIAMDRGWAGAVALSRSALYSPVWWSAVAAGTGGILAIGLCLSFAIGIGRRITRALNDVRAAIVELPRGKALLKATGIDEIDEIFSVFNRAQEELIKHEKISSLLRRELNHRSKNLLTVVQSISALTARQSDTLLDYKTKFNERLMALSRCQDVLIRNDWSSVALDEIVRSQVEPVADDRLRLEGEPVTIPGDLVQPICLVLHELAVNASKYGALSVPAGYVQVSWTGDDEGGDIRITWLEINGPTVVKPARLGFGSTVINQLCPVR